MATYRYARPESADATGDPSSTGDGGGGTNAGEVAPMPAASASAMAFLRWLESAGNAQELRIAAGQHLFNQPTTPQPRSNLLRRALGISGLWVYADELHGNQAVAQDLRQRSIAASVLLSGSSLIDYISSLGLFAFIFRLAPAGPIPYTLGLSTLLLLFGNWSGRAMVDRHKGQAIPNISLAIFIALSIFQSLTAGIGVFLFNGQARVVEARAEALIQSDLKERRRQIADLLDPSNPAIANDQEACNANRLQLGRIGADSPAYQQLSVETFGRWDDRRVPPSGRPRWELAGWPLSQWPLCPRVEHQRAQLLQQGEQRKTELANLEAQIRQAPSRADFLATSRPKVFEQVFLRAPDGRIELKDGVQAFGAAWEFFWNPPADYRSDLILSWVYMTISIITSTGAVALLYWQSRADNTRMSFAVPCGQYRFKLLSELRDRLPGEMQQFFLDHQRQRLEQRIPPPTGVAIEEISNLNPDFQTLAYLMQRGDATTQQEAQRQYWQHLINLYINDTSSSGDIDYDYLYNNVIGFWRNLKSASHVQAAPARFIDPPT
ncbi:MAG: hypothetical protein VKI42_07900 [Synechococcaceae cyanobacterium]|nr:hypothetical protein [Synechococcaceae cyanobacterium]